MNMQIGTIQAQIGTIQAQKAAWPSPNRRVAKPEPPRGQAQIAAWPSPNRHLSRPSKPSFRKSRALGAAPPNLLYHQSHTSFVRMDLTKEVFSMKIIILALLICTMYFVMKALEIADAPFEEECGEI